MYWCFYSVAKSEDVFLRLINDLVHRRGTSSGFSQPPHFASPDSHTVYRSGAKLAEFEGAVWNGRLASFGFSRTLILQINRHDTFNSEESWWNATRSPIPSRNTFRPHRPIPPSPPSSPPPLCLTSPFHIWQKFEIWFIHISELRGWSWDGARKGWSSHLLIFDTSSDGNGYSILTIKLYFP